MLAEGLREMGITGFWFNLIMVFNYAWLRKLNSSLMRGRRSLGIKIAERSMGRPVGFLASEGHVGFPVYVDEEIPGKTPAIRTERLTGSSLWVFRSMASVQDYLGEVSSAFPSLNIHFEPV